MHATDSVVEPPLQTFPPAALGKEEDAEPNLPQDDGIDRDLGLMLPEPLDDVG